MVLLEVEQGANSCLALSVVARELDRAATSLTPLAHQDPPVDTRLIRRSIVQLYHRLTTMHILRLNTCPSIFARNFSSVRTPRTTTVYVAAAKARKARMIERGAEVEQLLSLAEIPLLIDMSANSASIPGSGCGSNEKSAARNTFRDDCEPIGNGNTCEGAKKSTEGAGEAGASQRVANSDVQKHRGSRSSSGRKSQTKPAVGAVWNSSNTNGVAGGPAVEAAPSPQGSEGGQNISSTPLLSRSSSTPTVATLYGDQANGDATAGITTVAAAAAALKPVRNAILSGRSSPRGLDATRIVATASTPQLPCFSLGSAPQLAFRGGGAQKPNEAVGLQRRNRLGDGRAVSNGYNAVSASPDTNVVVASGGSSAARLGHGHARNETEASVSDRIHQPPRNKLVTTSTSSALGRRREAGAGAGTGTGTGTGDAGPGAAAAAAKAAVVAARNHASMLLASHLVPFPTITKNRALHAVSQPIVRHSEGFADACRGERSRAGTTAWRVAREARYDSLVGPADRLSIVRQIEAGCDALQGRTRRRVSPVA